MIVEPLMGLSAFWHAAMRDFQHWQGNTCQVFTLEDCPKE